MRFKLQLKILRNIVVLTITVIISFKSIAQNAANYTFQTDTSSSLTLDINSNFIDMSNGTTRLIGPVANNNVSPVSNIGFTFFLMGKPFTQFAIQDNGIIQLGGGLPPTNTSLITGGNANNPRLSAFGTNMNTGGTGEIHYKVFGFAPSRVCVIECKLMRIYGSFFGDPGISTFQVRLYESGVIEFVYGKMFIENTSTDDASIGFFVGNTNGSFASISHINHSVVTTGTFTPNSGINSYGPITSLSSTSDTTCRVYRLRPPNIPLTPTNLTFDSISTVSMSLNWVDNSTFEQGYRVFCSKDNGQSYQLFADLPANTTNVKVSNLKPGTRFYWKIIAWGEAGLSDTLSGNQITLNATLVKSTVIGGNWNSSASWIGGLIPSSGDSVVIQDGAVVVINIDSAICYKLQVGEGLSGVLEYSQTQAARLTVMNGLLIEVNGLFTAGSGNISNHSLQLGGLTHSDYGGGALTVLGSFDMHTSAKVVLSFLGKDSALVNGSPMILDFSSVIVNKGNSNINRPVLKISTNFTAQGSLSIGPITSHIAGIILIQGVFTQNNSIYANSNYSIPFNGGLVLKNPNFTVLGQNATVSCNGILHVSEGTYLVGTTALNALSLSSGSEFLVDGGSVIVAGVINCVSAITFTFSSGTITVANVGNPNSNIGSFTMSHPSSIINWSGGTIILAQRSTGTTQLDYNLSSNLTNHSNGILKIGNATTSFNSSFNIRGNVPNLVIDSSKNAVLRAQLNVFGDILVSSGSVLRLNGQILQHKGQNVTNNGFIDGRAVNSNWEFSPSASGHIYSGTGEDTLQRMTLNDSSAILIQKPIVSYGMFFYGVAPITNSNNIILGNGRTQSVVNQIGITGYSNGNVGTYDLAPNFNLGTGSYSVFYNQEGLPRVTGHEIPPNRILTTMVINNSKGVILNGGSITVSNTLTLTSGILITTTANLLIVTNTLSSAITGGGVNSYLNGPLQRRLPASLATNTNYIFHLGKDSVYNRVDLFRPRTNALGFVDVRIESFNGIPSGGLPDGSSLNALGQVYWTVDIPTGSANIDSASFVFYNSNLDTFSRIGKSSTLSGIYSRISNGRIGNTLNTSILLKDTAIQGVFAIGELSNPISGTYLIGANKISPNYQSLSQALLSIAQRKIVGDLSFLLDSDYTSTLETFPITLGSLFLKDSTITVTIKPNTGLSHYIAGNSASGIIKLVNGAKNFVIDGNSFAGNILTQNITLHNTNTSAPVVWFQGTQSNQGVRNSILKNTIIKGGSRSSVIGVLLGGLTNSIQSNGYGHFNLYLENNLIYNCSHAIVVSGTLNSNVKKISILNNTIGSSLDSQTNANSGIYLLGVDSVDIVRNSIKNVRALSNTIASGISLDLNVTNCKIESNTIFGVFGFSNSSSATDYGAYGINIQRPDGIDKVTILNNLITNILSGWQTGSSQNATNCYGIQLNGGTNIKIYNNTVHLYRSAASPRIIRGSAAIYISTNPGSNFDIRNNSFSNYININDTFSPTNQFVILMDGQVGVFDYNNIYYQGFRTYLSGNTYHTPNINNHIEAFKTLTNANQNTISVNPFIINDSSAFPNAGILQGKGQLITSVMNDILDSTRSNPPSIGAYEKGIDKMGPIIEITDTLPNAPLLGNRLALSLASISDYSGVNLTLAKPRLYYKKISDSSLIANSAVQNIPGFNGWKYTETTDTISPFGFTINYSLLTGGGASTWDTIQYFVVAQDQIDTNHFSAYPSAGFDARSINTISKAPINPLSYILIDTPLVGNYLVGKNEVSPNFSSITKAFKSLNLSGISGPVALILTDSTYSSNSENFPLELNEIVGASQLNTITIKPQANKSVAITASLSDDLFHFKGSDFVLIDGSNNGTNTKDLELINELTLDGSIIKFTSLSNGNGSKHCQIRNTVIKGGNSTNTARKTSGVQIENQSNSIDQLIGHEDIVIQKNLIHNVFQAISVNGSLSVRAKNIAILNNQLGVDSVIISLFGIGVLAQAVDSLTISDNIIQGINGIKNSTGILISGEAKSVLISKNTIKNINGFPDFPTEQDRNGNYGIHISGINNENFLLINNSISNVNVLEYWSTITSQLRLFGIKVSEGNNIKLIHNSVHLSGELHRGSGASLYINPDHTSGIEIINNTFSNTMTQGYTQLGKSHALYKSSGAPFLNYTFDYNNFFVSGPFGVLMGDGNGNQLGTMAALKTATGSNQQSVNIDPEFVNDTFLAPGLNTLSGLGIYVSLAAKDIEDSTRNNPPSIGAYENGRDIKGPLISFSPIPKQKSIANLNLINSINIDDLSGVNTTNAKPRLYFKKSTDSSVFGNSSFSNDSLFNGWKYVEASNNSSPFSFTIDYSLLRSGGVQELDTILYFVVAQDLSIRNNLGVSTKEGFVGAKVDSITKAPTNPSVYTIDYIPLSGNYLVGSGNSAPNFSTLTGAISALNLRGIQNAVSFQLTDSLYTTPAESFPISLAEIDGSNAINTVTIKPSVGNNAIIRGTTSQALKPIIQLNGSKHVIIDGSNNNTSSQNLLIHNTHNSGIGVWFLGNQNNNGCSNAQIKNSIVKGTGAASYGIIVGGNTNLVTSLDSIASGIGKGGGGHHGLLIQNNTIFNCAEAITISGESNTQLTIGLRIIGNTLGIDTPNSGVYKNAISMMFNDGTLIKGNTIENVAAVGRLACSGIFLGDYTTNCQIEGNIIKKIQAVNSTQRTGAFGISLETPNINNVTIANNVISNIISSHPNNGSGLLPRFNSYGVYLKTGSNINLYHNTIHLYDTLLGASFQSKSASLFVASAILNIRNNSLSNYTTSSTVGSKHYAIEQYSATYSSFDYNNYFVSGPQGILMRDSITQSDVNTLPGIVVATGANNINSVSIDPQFASINNLNIGDNTLQSRGVFIPSITKDVLDSLRNNPPSIGAFEGNQRTIPVPVKFIKFNGHSKEDNVNLSWATATETGNKGFVVEKSVDRVKFYQIGFVNGAGNSYKSVDYEYTDSQAFDTSNILYYRLRQIDFDGVFAYSTVLRITKQVTSINGLSVYPNPFTQKLFIGFNSISNGQAIIELFDLAGRSYQIQSSEVVIGTNRIEIKDANILDAGIYFVRLKLANESFYLRVMKE